MNKIKTYLTGIAFLLVSVAAAIEVPYLSARLNDYAGLLSGDNLQHISQLLKAHEDSTTNQVAVLTIVSLEGNNIEDYAYKVFNQWKLGQKEYNNGVLILVVRDDRQMRIEVGTGLEGILTDLMSSRIIHQIMIPYFRDEDYDNGISEGVKAVISLLEGDEEIQERLNFADNSYGFLDSSDADMTWYERLLIGLFIFGIIGLFTFIGIITPGGGGWFLYVFLIPFWVVFPIFIVGVGATVQLALIYLFGFPLAKMMIRKRKWYIKAREDLKTKGSASIGGFHISSGGSSWSSGSGGGSRSSGFSGGGGRSGGGGSSGRW